MNRYEHRADALFFPQMGALYNAIRVGSRNKWSQILIAKLTRDFSGCCLLQAEIMTDLCSLF